MAKDAPPENGYTIRQVIDLTGASEFLLRGWENRYKAFSPNRTKTGRRRYTEEDVLRARALILLTAHGARVGQLAHLPLASLQKLVDEQAQADTRSVVSFRVQEIMSKAHAFDWQGIRGLLLTERENRKGLHWINAIILPLLTEMAAQADSGRLTIAQERVLSAALKEALASPHQTKSTLKRGPRIVFATPEGDFHDLGLTVAAFIAREMKVDCLFLGAHVPKRELSEVCLRFRATHLVLTSTPSPEAARGEDYLHYVNFLDGHLPPGMIIWLAGRNAIRHAVALQRKFQILKSFQQYQEELRKCLKPF